MTEVIAKMCRYIPPLTFLPLLKKEVHKRDLSSVVGPTIYVFIVFATVYRSSNSTHCKVYICTLWHHVRISATLDYLYCIAKFYLTTNLS